MASTWWHHTKSNKFSSPRDIWAPKSYIVRERCEGTGRPSGWTNYGGGTISWDYTDSPAPLEGAQSLAMTHSDWGMEYYDVGGLSEFSLYFAYCPVTTDAADHGFFDAFDESLDSIFYLYHSSTGYLCLQDAIKGAKTSDYLLEEGTKYFIWVDYVASGTVNVFINTTAIKPTTPEITFTAGAASAIRYVGPSVGDGEALIFDDFIFDTVMIDSNPLGSYAGSTQNQALSGSFPAFSGSLGKLPGKVVLGGVTLASGITTKTSGKIVSGSMPSQNGSVIKLSTRNVSGSFPSVSGVVSKSTLKTLTGVLPALSGSIVGEFITGLIEEALAGTFPVITGSLDVIISKMLQGSVPAQEGTVVRITEKRVLGSAPSQSGSTVKSTAKEFEGQLGSVTGASLKLTAKNVSGLLPAISGVSSYVSVFLQEVLGAIPQITGAISKATTKAVTGIIPALSGSISRRAGKSLAGSIPYQVGGIVKDVDKKVQGAIPSLSGTASGVSVFLEGISGAVPYAVGSMVKMIGKGISGNAPSQAGQLVKKTSVSRAGSIPSPSGNPGEAYQTSEGTSGIFGAISGIVSYITGVIISKAVGIIGSRLKRIIGG